MAKDPFNAILQNFVNFKLNLAVPLHLPSAPQVLCECLVYACCIRQRLPAGNVADLAGLLHHLALKARSAGASSAGAGGAGAGGAAAGLALAAQQQAYLVLLAALLTVLPLENAEGAGRCPQLYAAPGLSAAASWLVVCVCQPAIESCTKACWAAYLLCGLCGLGEAYFALHNHDRTPVVPAPFPLSCSFTPGATEAEADERLLRELAANRELNEKMGGLGGSVVVGGGGGLGGEDAHCAALKLAWGVLLSQCGGESAAGEAGWVRLGLAGLGWAWLG